MSKKYFVFGEKKSLSKEQREKLNKETSDKLREDWLQQRNKANIAIYQKQEIGYVDGRVIIAIDVEGKNSWKLSDGTLLHMPRQFDNLNRRETEPVNAIVISAENIPDRSMILIHPNAVHDSNRIFSINGTSFNDEFGDVKYYSIPEDQCFAWLNEKKEWQPINPYETALRVFKPYKGALMGMEPELIKNTLFVTSGELNGKIVRTIKASDYEIIFQGIDGREERLIRFRPFGDEKTKREEEAIAIDNLLTDNYYSGDIFIGLSKSDAKPYNVTAYAD